ncbi:sensor histidine kinase [Photobacterium rosenbergii]|uniref:histidine kinase n=1 Tax=Photobacterium rosenbergii TaxID=294936 RepID=A0ABU3ZJJ1_9GAMM|nr:ATP-binding protein [Photobacterium rosenbergii]MDV5170280.1 ATP-binding protein [Photobacterium rosenbergii]
MSALPDTLPREQLVSILGNLIDNALEATLSHHGKGGTVTLVLSDFGKELIFEVEDQGPGISTDDQDKIFTRGYTTKTSQGHGIGLDLVKSLTDHLGGLITVESIEVGTETTGSRFTLYLPKQLNHNNKNIQDKDSTTHTEEQS